MSAADVWKQKLSKQLGDKSLQSTKGLYDEWANDYDEVLTTWDYQAPKGCVKLLKENMHLNMKYGESYKILDVGCGTGLVAKTIKDILPNVDIDITGIDISDKSLEIAKEKNICGRLIKLDITKFPYPSFDIDEFDCIICCGVMTYIRGKDLLNNLFKEWLRISKSNALIILTNYNDYMVEDKSVYYDNKDIKWGIIKHIENQPYIPNNENYADKKLIDYFVAQNLKHIKSKL